MTTISSYYIGMAIVAVVIFGFTLAYQTMRYDQDVKKNNPSDR